MDFHHQLYHSRQQYLMFPYFDMTSQQFPLDHIPINLYYPEPYLLVHTDSFYYTTPFQENFYMQTPLLTYEQIQPIQSTKIVKTQPSSTKIKQKVLNESEAEVESNKQSEVRSPEIRSRQKYGRNIHSNIYHHMLKNISTGQIAIRTISHILKKLNSSLGLQQFLIIFNKKLGKVKTYVSHQRIKDIFRGVKPSFIRSRTVGQKELQFLKIFRILCRNYLKNIHISYVFNSLKIKDKSKLLHLEGSRKLIELMI